MIKNIKKITSAFSSNFESAVAEHLTGKSLIFDFYPKGCLFWISRSANIHVVSFTAVFRDVALRDIPKNSSEGENSIRVFFSFDVKFNLLT